MITKDNFKEVLRSSEFKETEKGVFIKNYHNSQTFQMKADFNTERLEYAQDITIGRDTTSNFSDDENFVVFECVDRLLTKGYKPEHIELEPQWKLGHTQKGGYADIWVRTCNALSGKMTSEKDSLLIIECKKADEFDGAWKDTLEDGAQLFSYFQQEQSAKFLCLYTSDFDGNEVKPDYYLINVQDNEKLLQSTDDAKSYKDASNNKQLYRVWHDTYGCEAPKRGLFEKDIQAYNIGKNNAIKTLFMERAAQLMNTGGVAGIVLPVSVLNKGGIYAHARQIILETFDIVALSEFGSGTFGKTATNTVVLFLRRKETNTPAANHYRSRIKKWFSSTDNAEDIYEDEDLLRAYCVHCGYDVDDYKDFLKDGSINERLAGTEAFANYAESFSSTSRTAMKGVCDKAKTVRSRFNARCKTKTFKQLSEKQRAEEKRKAICRFITEIEKEKVYIFLLAYTVTRPVLIVKSPQTKDGETNKAIKKFLGYEWSDRNGNEGIQYLHIKSRSKSEGNEDGNADDDDTMQQIRGINGIETPLFDPSNLSATDKINTLIRNNFLGEEITVPDELADYVSQTMLTDMIDFKRTAFDKEIKTSAKSEVKIESKWPFVKLGDVSISKGGNTFPESFQGDTTSSHIPFFKVGDMNSIGNEVFMNTSNNYVENKILQEKLKAFVFPANTIIFPKVGMAIHTNKKRILVRPSAIDNNTMGLMCSERINYLYLYNYFLCNINLSDIASTANPPSINSKNLDNYVIPLPPLSVQQQIVDKCNEIDAEVSIAREKITTANKRIEQLFIDATNEATNTLRLNDTKVFSLAIGKRVVSNEVIANGKYQVVSANVNDEFGRINHSVLDDFSCPSVLWGIDGDWMVNYIEKDILFAPTDHCGVVRVLNEQKVLPKYLVYPLLKAGETERFSRAIRASTERVKSLSVNVPNIEIQKEVVEEVIECEKRIVQAKTVIAASTARKQTILDKYLK